VRNIRIICGKELRSYLGTPVAYVVAGVFLGLSGAAFAGYLAGTGYADTSLRGFLDAAQYLILLFSAVMTMRLVAEEKKLGTWELLITAPVRDVEVVLGKYLGGLGLMAAILLLTLYYPFLLIIFGDPDIGPMGASYLGLLLLGAASLAVGLFASTLTSNQIVSAVVAGGILAGMWFLGIAGSLAPGPLGSLLSYLSLSSHLPDLFRGVLDTRAVVYYLSVTAVFLFLAVRSAEADRWR
jgi:ABC-2 type transport system permease protein